MVNLDGGGNKDVMSDGRVGQYLEKIMQENKQTDIMRNSHTHAKPKKSRWKWMESELRDLMRECA